MNTPNESNEGEEIVSDDWLNEHGQPDFEFLAGLANDDGPKGLEKLKFIAEDVDAEYGQDATAQDLIQAIRAAIARNAGEQQS